MPESQGMAVDRPRYPQRMRGGINEQMDDELRRLLDDLDAFAELDQDSRADCLLRTQWIASAECDSISELLESLEAHAPDVDELAAVQLLDAVLSQLATRFRGAEHQLTSAIRHKICTLYSTLGEDSRVRHHLLSALTAAATEEDLHKFAELIVTDPPSDATHAAIPFFPLLNRQRPLKVSAILPRILDGIQHPQAAAPILDLANFAAREGLTEIHPARDRRTELEKLLGALTERLGRLEEHPEEMADSFTQLRNMVSDSVSLTVSLCDALSLIGNPESTPKLFQALELGHRRVRVEAAFALAKLGEQAGTSALIELAEEAPVRLRVLAYADELGLLDDIPTEHQTEAARAEAELVSYLAGPTQMGMAPNECELVDHRVQFWPGEEEATDCFLFRYSYELPQGSYSNIGIAGPLAFSLTADLGDLSPDSIYAAYAGWQAKHDEIYEINFDRLDARQLQQAQRFIEVLNAEGYQDIQPFRLGWFFGEQALLAVASRDGVQGSVVADNNGVYWYAAGGQRRPLGPDEAYYIYKGRKLLRSFNPA